MAVMDKLMARLSNVLQRNRLELDPGLVSSRKWVVIPLLRSGKAWQLHCILLGHAVRVRLI